MKQIIFITIIALFIFSFGNQSCKSNNEKIKPTKNITDSTVKTNQILFLNQFDNVKLPFSANNLKSILLENDGRDVFNKKIFESLNIEPLNKYNILKMNMFHYPVGKIVSNKYSIAITMYKENEAGVIDPVINAYIFNTNGTITDSLKIYRNYQWENVYKLDFDITADTIFILKEYSADFPYYGITEDQDSLQISEEKKGIRKYIINKHYKFEKIE